MPLIQGGPPEWIWERVAEVLKWEVLPATGADGRPGFELRANCGLEIVRLHFFRDEELKELHAAIDEALAREEQKGSAPSIGENASEPPLAAVSAADIAIGWRSSERKEGVVSDPDFVAQP